MAEPYESQLGWLIDRARTTPRSTGANSGQMVPPNRLHQTYLGYLADLKAGRAGLQWLPANQFEAELFTARHYWGRGVDFPGQYLGSPVPQVDPSAIGATGPPPFTPLPSDQRQNPLPQQALPPPPPPHAPPHFSLIPVQPPANNARPPAKRVSQYATRKPQGPAVPPIVVLQPVPRHGYNRGTGIPNYGEYVDHRAHPTLTRQFMGRKCKLLTQFSDSLEYVEAIFRRLYEDGTDKMAYSIIYFQIRKSHRNDRDPRYVAALEKASAGLRRYLEIQPLPLIIDFVRENPGLFPLTTTARESFQRRGNTSDNGLGGEGGSHSGPSDRNWHPLSNFQEEANENARPARRAPQPSVVQPMDLKGELMVHVDRLRANGLRLDLGEEWGFMKDRGWVREEGNTWCRKEEGEIVGDVDVLISQIQSQS